MKLTVIRKIVETRKAIVNHIEDKEWEIAEGLMTESEWEDYMDVLQKQLDKFIDEATHTQLKVLMTGRFYVGDDCEYYFNPNPSMDIPVSI